MSHAQAVAVGTAVGRPASVISVGPVVVPASGRLESK